jgi:hypothetical protein
MHKCVPNLVLSCEKLTYLFTRRISQHILRGYSPGLYSLFTGSVQSLFTHLNIILYLLFGSFTRYQQALLQELQFKYKGL